MSDKITRKVTKTSDKVQWNTDVYRMRGQEVKGTAKLKPTGIKPRGGDGCNSAVLGD